MRLSRLDHTTTRSPVSLTLRPGLGQLVQAIRLVIVSIWCGNAPKNPLSSEVEFFPRKEFCMKRSRFTDSQIMEALKRVEAGLPVPELCREFGISTATFYKWRAKFGGMDTSMMARMKELEEENRRLKKLYIDEKLKAEIVAEALAKKW